MSINKDVLKLAIPNIISNIAIPVNGMIDLAILGHIGSMHHIGALALGSLIFNFIYWNFAFLRMGASGMTAQAFGARNKNEMSLVLYRALAFGILGGIVLIIFQYPIYLIADSIIDSSNDVMLLTKEYYFIRIYAAPATVGIYALTGWFVGMQNSVTPMVAAIIVNISNILLNLLFVFGFDMLIDGVAIGTVIAQYIGFAFLLLYIYRKYKHILQRSVLKISSIMKGMGRFFKINIDIFLRTFMVIVVMSFFTSKSAAQNDEILAVNTILLQYFLVFSFFLDGFAYAAEALVGKYIGARDVVTLKKVISYIFKWAIGVSIAISGIFFIGDSGIIKLLTGDEHVIARSLDYLIWVQLIPVISFTAFVWDGIYIGATQTKTMRNSLFFAAICFFACYFFLFPKIGNHGIWIAFYAYMICRGIYQWIFAKNIYSQLSN